MISQSCEPRSGLLTAAQLAPLCPSLSLLLLRNPAHAEHGDYELVLVSPRNHMVYTPLLPSKRGGALLAAGRKVAVVGAKPLLLMFSAHLNEQGCKTLPCRRCGRRGERDQHRGEHPHAD